MMKKPTTKEELVDVLKHLKKWKYRDDALKYAEMGLKFGFGMYLPSGIFSGESVISSFNIVYFIDSEKMHGYWFDDDENGDYHCLAVSNNATNKASEQLKRHFAVGSLSEKIVKINQNDKHQNDKHQNDKHQNDKHQNDKHQNDKHQNDKHQNDKHQNDTQKNKSSHYHDDYHDDYDYYEYNDAYEAAMEKNLMLVQDLEEYRESFCGIGTRKVKLRLNKHCDEPDVYYIRQLLELEDINIQAKKYRGDYKRNAHDRKEQIIQELVNFCSLHGNYVYGFEKSNNYSASAVVYFELPDCVQVSFHCNLSLTGRKMYTKKWDGRINSTLPKLEKYILEHFADYIADKKKK